MIQQFVKKSIHKKFQITICDILVTFLSQKKTKFLSEPQEKIFVSNFNLKFGYIQLKVDPEMAKQFVFYIMSGDMTRTYRYKTGFL